MAATTLRVGAGLGLVVAILFLVTPAGVSGDSPNAPQTGAGQGPGDTSGSAPPSRTSEPGFGSEATTPLTRVAPGPPQVKEPSLTKKTGPQLVGKAAPESHTAGVKEAQKKRMLRSSIEQNPPAAFQQAAGMFMDMCSSCHGHEGYGDGPWHTEFQPQPANLSLVNDSPALLRSIVLGGIPGTMMPAFPDLSNQNIDGIFRYLGLQARDLSNQWAYPWELHSKLGSKLMQVADPTMGRQDFVGMCAGCHGASGKGDGSMANLPTIWPKPANLTARNSDIGRLYYIITEGRQGTYMAYNKDKIPELGRWQLAAYVHSLYDPNAVAMMRRPTQAIPTSTNPYLRTDRAVAEDGHSRFNLWCAPCHGSDGRGSFVAPRLIDRYWKYAGGTDTAVFTVVENGIPGKLMVSFKKLSPRERWAIITFIRSRGGLPDPMTELTFRQQQQNQPPSPRQQSPRQKQKTPPARPPQQEQGGNANENQ